MSGVEGESDLESLSDEALMGCVREGDPAALQILTARYVDRLHRHVERRLSAGLRRRVDASDILQEAHLVAFERSGDFEDRGEGSFRRWFDEIVENRIRDAVHRHVKAQKRSVRRETTRAGRPETRALPARPATPSRELMATELGDAVHKAIAALPPRDREVLELLQGQRLTTEEAARHLGLSRAAVRQRYGRALAKVEEALGLAEEKPDGRRRPTR